MKRNITVNICGSLYNIDEDAYTLLNKYLDDTRAFFSRQPEGKEIADDIEWRVSELMSEMRESGSAIVTIEDVQNIIQRVGTPEEMDETNAGPDLATESHDNGTVPPPPPATNSGIKAEKKLYRDFDHKMLGGVLAGFGQYFGIDPLWLRLLALVLAVVSWGTAIILYILLWILIPPATTPADKLRMRGEPVNMESLGDEIISTNTGTDSRRNDASFINSLLHLLCVLLKGALIVLGVMAILMLGGTGLWMIVMMVWAIISADSFIHEVFDIDYGAINLGTVLPPVPTWGLFVSGLVCLGLTIYLLIYLMLRMAGKTGRLPKWRLGTTVIAWVASLIFSAVCLGAIIGNITMESSIFNRTMTEYRQHRDQQAMAESLRELRNNGWTLEKSRNVKNFISNYEDYQGVRGRRYLHAHHPSGDMDYEVVRHIKVAPGQYVLTAAARTNGNGAEIFAVNGAGHRSFAEIPAYGSEGGGIWLEATKFVEADTVGTSAEYKQMKRIAKVNDDKGYGWSRVIVSDITVGPDSVLTYGVTNCSPSSIWDGTWLSASDFKLTPNNKKTQ